MITDINQLDLDKTYSYADYLKWRFDERLELIKGKIFKMSPSRARTHQRISGYFQGELCKFPDNKTCPVNATRFGVRHTVCAGGQKNKPCFPGFRIMCCRYF